MSNFLAVLIVILSLLPSKGESAELILGQWSKHIIAGEFNESHDLIGVQTGDYTVATFINSYGQRSIAAGRVHTGYDSGKIRLSATAGVVYGYDMSPLLPMLVATANYKVTRKVSIDFNISPAGFASAGFRYNLGE